MGLEASELEEAEPGAEGVLENEGGLGLFAATCGEDDLNGFQENPDEPLPELLHPARPTIVSATSAQRAIEICMATESLNWTGREGPTGPSTSMSLEVPGVLIHEDVVQMKISRARSQAP